MGQPKAALPWRGTTLLDHVAGVVAAAVSGPVVVVRAPGQDLPVLGVSIDVVDDPVAGRGPLQGIAAGLAAVADRAGTAFVCATDLGFLHPAFVRCLLATLAAHPDAGVALPVARGYPQPLAAAYRTNLASTVAALVDGGERRPDAIWAHTTVVRLGEAALLSDPALAEADPELASLRNINTPEDYEAARGLGSDR